MKTHVEVSSSRRKCRKAQFTAPSHIKYRLMSAHLSKDLRSKHGIRSLPVRKGDEVKIVRGLHKNTVGKITTVYRKRNCVYVEKITKNKANGSPYQIPLQASNLVIEKLKLDRDRQNLIKRKSDGAQKVKKDKYDGQMD